MKKRKLDERADRAARKMGRRITPTKQFTLESFLLFLALLCIFALIIIFTVLRVQYKGRNVDPIPIVPEGEASGGKSWKFWNKDS